ncbi:MAG TPA: hypothetical protein VMJ10_32025 [Kofleriaceae bacterium]|nr:hypothetical protein [Kofleriaceae bacterium]
MRASGLGLRASARVGVIVLALWAGAARADSITVGLFAPSAPFPSTAARVELASKLAEQIGAELHVTASGKVFARASDFAEAVKRGEIAVALVDATYLATSGGGYTILAGDAPHAWHLVAHGGKIESPGSAGTRSDAERRGGQIDALRGKKVLVPAFGGREAEFVLNALLGGEVARDYFAKIEPAPDTASALAALGLGHAEAAIVPVGVELPPGVSEVLALPQVAGPVLVAYGPLSAERKAALVAAATGLHGDATIAGFRAVEPDAVRRLAARFAPIVKRGPLAVPAIRLLVGDLVEGRTLAIERTPPNAFAIVPERK